MSEQDVQKAIAAYLDRVLPDLAYWTAVNPVPAKSKAAAGLSKAMGMKAGCPDIVICFAGRFIGIEVKTEGGRLSPAQRETHTAITLAGGAVFTARSVEDVEETLRMLCVPLKGTVAA